MSRAEVRIHVQRVTENGYGTLKEGETRKLKELNVKRRRYAVILTLLLAFVLVFSKVNVFAADSSDPTYYAENWNKYTEENQPAGDQWTWNEVTDAIEKVLNAGLEMMKQGDTEGARKAASVGYYGYYDSNGFENLVHGISGSRVSQTELEFSKLRTIATEGTADEYEAEMKTLMDILHEDANTLDGVSGDSTSSSDSGSGSTEAASTDTSAETSGSGSSTSSSGSGSGGGLIFAACFGIILREGFEAIIVVGAIIAYMQVKIKNENGNKKKLLYPIYFGALLGIAASFIVALILDVLLLNNSANQEIIEGVTALIAVCVLFYVCNWMLHRTETEAWSKYIKSKTTSASEKGSVMALAFTAFLAVFREGAEVVLFFQPYLISGEHLNAVWGGMILGGVALVFVYLIIYVLSVNVPIRPFFTATSILMAVMCVSFLGAGIKELIEGGALTSHSPIWLQWIPYNDVLDILGIYPLIETIIPQIILTIVMILLFHHEFKKNRAMRKEVNARKAKEEAERKAKEEKEAEEALNAKIRSVVIDVLKEQKLIADTQQKPEKGQQS